MKKNKNLCPLNDFQVFKGRCEQSMKSFGSPVMAHHEARLIIRDDQANAETEAKAMYAIYKRSENRILQIISDNVRALGSKPAARLSTLEQVRLKFAA
ncbi:MAG TPA: hypothetical protein VHZ55_05945 [Bryobacteraceae bacterium]|jgi:hypothetical protein|nr:hypothetical protein [Bryobacteraceae bacterium]